MKDIFIKIIQGTVIIALIAVFGFYFLPVYFASASFPYQSDSSTVTTYSTDYLKVGPNTQNIGSGFSGTVTSISGYIKHDYSTLSNTEIRLLLEDTTVPEDYYPYTDSGCTILDTDVVSATTKTLVTTNYAYYKVNGAGSCLTNLMLNSGHTYSVIFQRVSGVGFQVYGSSGSTITGSCIDRDGINPCASVADTALSFTGGFAPPPSGVATQTSPTATTYVSNPITFSGTYNNNETFDRFEVSLTNTTHSYTLSSLYASTTLQNGTGISYSFQKNLPLEGSYSGFIRLYDTTTSSSTPWVNLTSFGLGTTTASSSSSLLASPAPLNCETFDIACYIKQALVWAVVPTDDDIDDLLSRLHENVLTHFPVGYITDFVSIMSTTTASSLTIIDATLPSTLGLGTGNRIQLDLTGSLDFILNATSTIFNNSSATSTQTFFEITNYYWKIILYILLAFYIVGRIIGSHLIPDFQNRNTLTQNMKQAEFSDARAEEYRYKEWLYKHRK